MLRLHFAAGDLARTHIADGPDPLWESVLSLHRLRETRPESVLPGWRERVLCRSSEPLHRLLQLVPARGYFPDFLTPAASAAGFEEGLEAVLSTSRGQLRAQVGTLAQSAPLTPWAHTLGEGRAGALRELGSALRAHRRIALESCWSRIAARVEADRMWRSRVQWLRGTAEMLRTFEPAIRWRSPVLEADYPVDKDVWLEGRGLLLVPSYFCHRTPVALADSALPPVLVYPARIPDCRTVGKPAHGPAGQRAGREELARLMGHTRAAVLQSLRDECTTSELACRAGVSLSSASEHASVLRAAGLVSSSRRRNTVEHALTSVGLALLDDGVAGAAGRSAGRAPVNGP
ncbi:winged helix-turn-helix domain-containing protein [Streptomyces sp. NBC_01795]|uniref:ArsR/SmtB family transcription factor n=1 Tax=Streptomyces sp. NBC_01795 TaxID=2975943 RepID=UPI002DDC23BD|nr:helix-turn-helix domain-containing protein [Streptomyces sp. NBC_01795]WSA91615.1 winged helix-turn-helix domain-containing protein [Streptomyces sp. NBC_01795]